MKKIVRIPITGSLTFEVEAKNDEEAKDKAWKALEDTDVDKLDITWEATDKVMDGSVCHAELWDIEVETP